MTTPEFLVWAIEFACPIRGFQTGSDPERTERQLRAARSFSDARREGRVFEGLCVDPPDGFRIAESLAVFGGLEAIERACGACPANALQWSSPRDVAGCYGIVALPDNAALVHNAIESALLARQASGDPDSFFPATSPRWYGLWMTSPLEFVQVQAVKGILDAAQVDDPSCRATIGELSRALDVAVTNRLRLHVRLYPPGFVAGPWWRLIRHCPRCQAAWAGAQSKCKTCHCEGRPAQDNKRHARGRRPYFPLSLLLGEQAAAEFLSRYARFREEQASRSAIGWNSASTS